MATLALTDGAVLADGRVVRLRFAVEPVPAAWGQPDWRPGFAAGDRLTLSTGGTCEFLGVVAQAADLPVPNVSAAGGGTGGALPTGYYHVACALVETASGDEVAWTRIESFHLPIAGDIPLIDRIVGGLVPSGHTVRVYLSAAGGAPDALTLYRSGVADPYASLDAGTWEDDAQPFAPGRLVWEAAWLAPEADIVTYADGETVAATAPAGLLRDGDGNATAALAGATLQNYSLADATGFTAADLPRGAGGVALHVSWTHGDDARDLAAATDPATPVQTVARAITLVNDNGHGADGSAIRLLRGDTWTLPDGEVLQVFSGTDRRHPFVLESYWHAGFGTDPATRPLVLVPGKPSGDNASALLVNRADQYFLIRGLHLRRADTDGALGDVAPGGLTTSRPGPHATIADMVIERFSLGLGVDCTAVYSFADDPAVLRTVVMDSFHPTQFSQGALFNACRGLLLSQCVFDRNGRKDAGLATNTTFDHSTYVHQTCTPPIAWGNLIREGGCNGLQSRAGLIAAYNVLSANGYNGFLGQAGGTFRRNVSEKARHWTNPDLSAGNGGDGLSLNSATGAFELWEENVSAHEQGTAITLGVFARQPTRGALLRNNTVAGSIPFMTPNGANFFDTSRTGVVLRRNLAVAGSNPIYSALNPPPDWDWLDADGNAYASDLAATGWVLLDGTDGTLAGWTAATGSDATSVAGAITLADGTYDLGDHHASLGGAGTEAAYVTLLRDRPWRAWGAAYDVSRAWAGYAAAYRPTGLAAPGVGGWDYYGAADYRAATTRKRFPFRKRPV